MKEKESNKIFENDLINLSQIFKLLLKSKLLVIIVVSIFALAGIYYGNLNKSSYSAKADIFFGTFDGKNIAHSKIIDTYLDGINWNDYDNPGGGRFLRLKSSSHDSAEEAEHKLQEAIDFLLDYTNNIIEEKIEIAKANVQLNEIAKANVQLNLAQTIQEDIDFINREYNKKVQTDGYSIELLSIKLDLIDLEVRLEQERNSNNSILTIPEYKLSTIINEIKVFENTKRPTYFYFLVGAIIGFFVSVFLVVSRFLEE